MNESWMNHESDSIASKEKKLPNYKRKLVNSKKILNSAKSGWYASISFL